MARIEWVKRRLENWALWKDRGESGSLGFPSSSSFLNTSSSGGYREAIIPVDECEAAVTNDAVLALGKTKPDLADCIHMIYVMDTGIRGAAQRLCKAESTVKAQLERADHALSEWFGDRAEQQKKRRMSFTP